MEISLYICIHCLILTNIYKTTQPPSKVLLRFMRAVISFECAGRQNITRLTRLDGGLFIIPQNKPSVSASLEYHFQQGEG